MLDWLHTLLNPAPPCGPADLYLLFICGLRRTRSRPGGENRVNEAILFFIFNKLPLKRTHFGRQRCNLDSAAWKAETHSLGQNNSVVKLSMGWFPPTDMTIDTLTFKLGSAPGKPGINIRLSNSDGRRATPKDENRLFPQREAGCIVELRVRAKAEILSGGKTPFVKLVRLADMDPKLERDSP